jgi:hypothetical protein
MSVLDSMDELLFDLPSEPLPSDLVQRIQANIAAHRKRWQRLTTLLRFLHVVMAFIGIGLLLPRLEGLLSLVPAVSFQKMEIWLRLVFESPNEASLEMISSLENWSTSSLQSIETVALFALLLLAFAGFLGLRQFLRRNESQEGVLV